MKKKSHVHSWGETHSSVLGYYSKRDDRDTQTKDAKWYVGNVDQCRDCPAMMFHPNGSDLKSVEVTVATNDEINNAQKRTPSGGTSLNES